MTDGSVMPSARIVVEAGRIAAITPMAEPDPGDIAVRKGWIAPGLIDLQVNGAGGVDLTAAADPEAAVAAVARLLVRHGVTAFCPTLISSPADTIVARLAACGPRDHAGGATSLGAHVEGPYLAPAHRGAHDPTVLRRPDPAEIARWLEAGPPALVTLAPELPGALAAIRQLTAAGVAVSLGHSGADLTTARAAREAGAGLGTHLFNAMAPLHHRAPGLAGALLTDARLIAGLIADGVHVDPVMVQLAVRSKGVEGVALVSDAAAPAGTPPGPGTLGGQPVVSDGRTVRRSDGTLAGSAALLDACLRHARDWLTPLNPAQVIRMATETPARALGPTIAARKGRLAPGYDADLIILDPAWHVLATWVMGVRCWGLGDVEGREVEPVVS